ncbi:Ni/Fe-hydrogenase cytochrome b subunit, partial [bacterium]
MNAKLTNLKDRLGRLTVWQGVLLAVLAAGLYATVLRFARGLGAATNLSDQFPWGLWIGFDVLVGVGLAAGGFVIAATVHVFRMERYEPIARPAVLTAFLGYVLVIVALLFDLGLPFRIWHPLIMWNPHSVMFEVAWCVTLYTAVLALEFSPLVFERFGWKWPLKVMRSIYVPLVIVGVLLSTLHQSSLGSLYVIAPDKLHGLWYSPLLPVFFFVSAVAGGLAMTIFESFMSYRAFGKRLEPELLSGLARVAVVVLGVYALLKVQDLAGRGALGLVLTLTPESVL